MKKYLGSDVQFSGSQNDLSGFMEPEHLKVHLDVVQGHAMLEIERSLEVSLDF